MCFGLAASARDSKYCEHQASCSHHSASPNAFSKSAFAVRIGRIHCEASSRQFLPSGLVFHDVMLHERNDIRWISFPAHEWHNAADEKQYARFVEFRDRAAQHAPLLELKEPAHEIVGVASPFYCP